MRFLFPFGKTAEQLATEKAAAEKAAYDVRWGQTKKEHQPGMNQEQREAALKAYHAKQDAAYAQRGHDWNAQLQVKKGEPAAIHYATKFGAIEENPVILKGKKKQFDETKLSALASFESRQQANVRYVAKPSLSESNYQKHEDAPSKQALDAKKKAFWHAKNEAEKAKTEAFKEASKAKTVATNPVNLDEIKVEDVGPKKPTFFDVSAARRKEILEKHKALSAEEKTEKLRKNVIESSPKPGFGM